MEEESKNNKFEIHIVGHDDVLEIRGFGGKNEVIRALLAAVQDIIQKGENIRKKEVKYDA